MSTKISLAYDVDYHLYLECFENDCVYLEMKGDQAVFEIDNSRILVRIPKKVFKEMQKEAHLKALEENEWL